VIAVGDSIFRLRIRGSLVTAPSVRHVVMTTRVLEFVIFDAAKLFDR
jgi:hypothetical protein